MTQINLNKTTKHKCNKAYCLHCNKIKEIDHECFMKVCKIPKDPKLPTLYFFDFETCVDENGYMVPFYCVIQKVCAMSRESLCEKEEHFIVHAEDARCDISIESVPCCGYRQYVFKKGNNDIVEELVDFMLAQPEDSMWMAHNRGRFDTVFLLRELLVKRKIVPKVIMNGTSSPTSSQTLSPTLSPTSLPSSISSSISSPTSSLMSVLSLS